MKTTNIIDDHIIWRGKFADRLISLFGKIS